MKSMFRQLCCVCLVASLLLQVAPLAVAQAAKPAGPLSAVYNELLEARRILSEDAGAKQSQSAVPALDRAKRLVNERSFAKDFPCLAPDLRKGVEQARLKVLWNDRNEAIVIINRLLGLIDGMAKKPVPPPQNPCGNGPGAGAMLGATLLAGMGALILLFFTGQVSHR